jgi:WD40 repeat protein
MQEMYHLYHHQPEPLDPAEINDEIWLTNNGESYRFVATIKAVSPEQAYEGLRAKMEGHSLRAVEVSMRPLMRATLPGDVLVGERKAWMVLPDGQLRHIPYNSTPTWKTYTHYSLVACLSWSPDGRRLAVCSDHLHLHDLLGREELHTTPTYRRHKHSSIHAVAWSPDGTRIASGDSGAEVHLWKPSPESCQQWDASLGSIVICRTEEPDSSYMKDIQSLTWSPDACTVLAGRRDGSVVEWDATTGTCLRIVRRNAERTAAFVWTGDGTRIASLSEEGVLRLWSLEEEDLALVCEQAGRALACAWAPDGALLVSSCKGEESLQCWDTFSGTPGERIPLSISSQRLLDVQALSWSPDGRFLAAGCDDGTLQIIDMQRRRHIQTYRVAQMPIDGVAWSPDGCSLACGAGSAARIWQWEDVSSHDTDIP